jgi:hypothetical protein
VFQIWERGATLRLHSANAAAGAAYRRAEPGLQQRGARRQNVAQCSALGTPGEGFPGAGGGARRTPGARSRRGSRANLLGPLIFRAAGARALRLAQHRAGAQAALYRLGQEVEGRKADNLRACLAAQGAAGRSGARWCAA